MLQRNWNNKTVELMCHPGLAASEYETSLVLKQKLSEYIEYKLINYKDLEE